MTAIVFLLSVLPAFWALWGLWALLTQVAHLVALVVLWPFQGTTRRLVWSCVSCATFVTIGVL